MQVNGCGSDDVGDAGKFVVVLMLIDADDVDVVRC